MEPEPDLDPVQDGMTRHVLLCGNHEKDAPMLRVLKGYYAKYGDRLKVVTRHPFRLMSYRGFVRRYETLRKIEYKVLSENHFDPDSEEQLPPIPPDMA